ncbi:hypothetical protein GCM10027592_60240 [Spirosoma flavus]
MRTVLIFSILILLGFPTLSQPKGSDHQKNSINTDPDLKNFQERCRQQVEALQNYLSIIADPNTAGEDKEMAIDETLRMFLKGSTMQVSSIKNPKQINTLPLETYLQNLSKLSSRKNIKEVTITFFQPVKVSDFSRNQDGTYSGTATYFQQFEARTVSGRLVRDRTQKNIDTLLKSLDDPFVNEKRWALLLGNITVMESTPAVDN